MFIPQWLARPLGSFKLDIIGKLKNCFYWVFSVNFISDTLIKFKKNWHCPIPEEFIPQWLARSLGSFELEIFGKLKNWFILGFYVKFTSDTLKNFKKMTLSNSRRVHSSMTGTFPGFIRSKYILKTPKLSFFFSGPFPKIFEKSNIACFQKFSCADD